MAEEQTSGPAWLRSLDRRITSHPLEQVPTHSYGLPGMPDGPARAPSAPVWVRAVLLVLGIAALGGAVAVLLLGPLVAVAVGLLVVAVVALAVVLEGPVRHRGHSRRLRAALEAYAPTVAMAYAGRSGGPWQLRMWEPYLRASGEPCVIINVHAKYVERILTEGVPLESPFIQLGTAGTDLLDDVLVPSLRGLFYVQNAQRNAVFMQRRDLTHVWLNHGDSDKPASFNPRHADYDKLVVPGRAGVERYARHGIHVAPEKFEVLGRPQASGLKPPRGPMASLDQPRVFYAPTWQGLDDQVNFSSLEIGPDIVRALVARGARVIFRPHPLSYRWKARRAVIQQVQAILRADREADGPRHVWGKWADREWSIADCSNKSDALISDVSSVVSDWLQSEKPYAMTSMRTSVEAFRAEYAVAETAYVLLGDLSNLDEVLDDLLERDPLAEARTRLKRHVLGDHTATEAADAFAAFVRRVAAQGR